VIEMWEMGTAATQLALPGAAGKRILVVEDSQFFRQLITRCLESAGHVVVTAADGTEGIRQLAAESFDLVVSDIEMPGLDGLALARHIRREARFEPLPLLALTSLSSAEDHQRVLAAGFDAHEVKFDRRHFLGKVQALLTQGRPGGPDRV
jgi:CheY-like chemotaxis protein